LLKPHVSLFRSNRCRKVSRWDEGVGTRRDSWDERNDGIENLWRRLWWLEGLECRHGG
jgi:hypothetical protein